MFQLVLSGFFITLILVFIPKAKAQVGASTSPLLMESVAQGRYEIRPQKPTSSVAKVKGKKIRTPASDESAEPATVPVAVSAPVPSTVLVPVLQALPEVNPDDDIRNNRMEISGSPTFVYNGSAANYSYRNYTGFFSALDLTSNVWLTPELGVTGRFQFSFGASIPGDNSTSSRIPVKYEDFDVGLKFRKFIDSSLNSNNMEFDVVYSEFKLSPPSDNLFHPKLTSSGLGARVVARIPTSNSYAWVLRGTFYPRLLHKEDRVGMEISSGSSNENTRLGIDLGGEFKLSRENQFIYNFSLNSERDSFTGSANPVDQETNKSPSNVSVTNTFVGFSFGYRWGR